VEPWEFPTGAGSRLLLPNLSDPHNFAIDANYVYYAGGPTPLGANDLTTVTKVPKTGGTPTAYSNCSPCPAPGFTSLLGGTGPNGSGRDQRLSSIWRDCSAILRGDPDYIGTALRDARS
jgi:hypothetical protein